jgi:hypothetical protein
MKCLIGTVRITENLKRLKCNRNSCEGVLSPILFGKFDLTALSAHVSRCVHGYFNASCLRLKCCTFFVRTFTVWRRISQRGIYVTGVQRFCSVWNSYPHFPSASVRFCVCLHRSSCGVSAGNQKRFYLFAFSDPNEIWTDPSVGDWGSRDDEDIDVGFLVSNAVWTCG